MDPNDTPDLTPLVRQRALDGVIDCTSTDTPDLTPLVRQRALDGLVESLLQAAFEPDGTTRVDSEDGREYSLVVDDTSGGFIKATLWHELPDGDCTEAATVTLDCTVTMTTPGGAA